MTDLEYDKAITEIIESGRGYDAIGRMVRMLEHEKYELRTEISLMNARRDATACVFDMSGTNKDKLNCLRKYFAGEDGEADETD